MTKCDYIMRLGRTCVQNRFRGGAEACALLASRISLRGCARHKCLAILKRAAMGWNRESGSKPQGVCDPQIHDIILA
jgi:hypothetical protein